jgi:hypothetical protein
MLAFGQLPARIGNAERIASSIGFFHSGFTENELIHKVSFHVR